MFRDETVLRFGWPQAWLIAALLAALLWLVHQGLRPANPDELRLVTGTVQHVSYEYAGRRSSRRTTQVLVVSTDEGREIFRLPRYHGLYNNRFNPGVPVSAGDRIEARVSSYNGVYFVRIGGRDVVDYATARATFVHRQVLPGILASSMTLAAMFLALATWFWPQIVAALGVPGVRRRGSMPSAAERGRLADLQTANGIPGSNRLRSVTPRPPH